MVGSAIVMPSRIFTAAAPLRAYHGSCDLTAFNAGMPPASSSHWFSRARWEAHDDWMSGGPHLDGGIPYANIVWEALGLRHRRDHREDVAPWARNLRSHDRLAREYGIMFVTDNEQDARRYGTPIKIDLQDDAVIDVLEDPHVRTHAGWIVIIAAGTEVPFVRKRRSSPG